MPLQWEPLGITPKRLERISSFDLDSEPEKIKLRKKSNGGISLGRKEQSWGIEWGLGEKMTKGKVPRCLPGFLSVDSSGKQL